MATVKTTKKQTTFEKLSSINVNKFVEKKNGLTYLSWAYAWSETKKNCPSATYAIGETEYDDATGFMCHTEVTIDGETLEMWLPVMDGANKSMKKVEYTYTTRYGEKQVAPATSFDVNKTIMRCLVKNLAMFGLGIYIYAGDDLPNAQEEAAPTVKAKAVTGKDALRFNDSNWSNVAKFVAENKQLGLKKLIDKVEIKYTITPAVKAEIQKLLK
tara:strand:- start:2963 stop:3604 length:642 start_codon:yes stop_codon:yes gene_type:complete